MKHVLSKITKTYFTANISLITNHNGDKYNSMS